MSVIKEDIFEYEDGPYHKPFDFINRDLDLLFLLIFIEAFKAKREELNFGEFFKGNYWNIDQVSEEIIDTNDYYSIPDMVIEQALFVLENTRIGKVIEIGVDDTEQAVKDLLIEIAKIGPENAKKDALNYYQSVEQLFFLSHQKSEQLKARFEKNPESYKQDVWRDKSVFFTKQDGYFRALQTLIIDTPTHIVIRVKYNDVKVKEIEKEIGDYLGAFSRDEYIKELPLYQEKRLYFAQQIENFYRYISRLPLIGDTVNVPFAILNENGFEPVKILCFLQRKDVVRMRWSDEGSWKLQFIRLPITPEILLGMNSEIVSTDTSLKSGLSFDEATFVLTIGGYSLKINGPDQKEFLKIIFKDPKELSKEWFFSEIAEVYDFAGNTNDKKFYNASYQLNLKVAQKTPIKDFLITTKQSVRVNPKYLKS